jgi:hypothetical protein
MHRSSLIGAGVGPMDKSIFVRTLGHRLSLGLTVPRSRQVQHARHRRRVFVYASQDDGKTLTAFAVESPGKSVVICVAHADML